MIDEIMFLNGNEWIKADFHLHTRADKEFKYEGEDNTFVTNYITKLDEEAISLACITNHNKFNWEEYKALYKKGKQKNIHILPGAELSVGDGSNGIHCLIVFDPNDWLVNGHDAINEFIGSCFKGKAKQDYENENGRSDKGLLETLKDLEEYKRSFFIILAHVDQKSGFFEALDGGRISEIAKDKNFIQNVLGFQKANTRDNLTNLKQWAPHYYPALLQGSDAKSIDQLGRGKPCFLKLGSFDFEAIKYALTDHRYRVADDIPLIAHGYVKSIKFTGGKLDDQTIHFNDGMTNLIGIRGSGKSSILEALRYALDIRITDNDNSDYTYKSQLINELLSSGGEMKTTMIDVHGEEYVAKKRIGERSTVYKNGEQQTNLKPESIVRKPIYYGQKDLSKIGDALSTESLINRLVGSKTQDIRQLIEEKKNEVIEVRDNLVKISSKLAKEESIKEKKADLTNKIKIFKDHEIDTKLDRQISFDKDLTYVSVLDKSIREIISTIEEAITDGFDIFEVDKSHTSKFNDKKIKELEKIFDGFLSHFEILSSTIESMKLSYVDYKEKLDLLNKSYKGLQDEFAEVKRNIDLPNIEADQYVTFSKNLDLVNLQLKELSKIQSSRLSLIENQQDLLKELQNLWAEEFRIVNAEVEKVNADQSAITIDMTFRGNKDAFVQYLKETLKGSNISSTKIVEIANNNVDLIELYNSIQNETSNLKQLLSETQYATFIDFFKRNMSAYLTYRVPDFFDIKYQGRSIGDHSLGQRASALIVFILSLKESEIIIIDQPEDDLDNQTIYQDVITSLKELKSNTQFVFATHNPNIPVLGDAEQVIACEYDRNKINTIQGSIDGDEIRKKIVDIMEGGEDAFNKRKEIYELWTL